jgi:hypothetical protein
MRGLKINKQTRPDTPLAPTPPAEYTMEAQALKERTANIIKEKAEMEKKKEPTRKPFQNAEINAKKEADIIKQSKDNEAEKQKAYNQQIERKNDSIAQSAAKDTQKSQSSDASQRTNSSFLNRR